MAESAKKQTKKQNTKPEPTEIVLIRATSTDSGSKATEEEINDLISKGWTVKHVSTGGGGHNSMFRITSVFVMEKKENNTSSNIN